ncbi:MAG: formyltransferase family protein, partial [Natrinema limicola]
MTRIAGMAGNRGRNLLNIADRKPGGAEFAVILTNTEDAPVLEAADERGIPTEVVPLAEDMSRREHEEAVLEALSEYEFDLVCLDGYMRILSDTFLSEAPTTLNVHPASSASPQASMPGNDGSKAGWT